MYLLYSSPRRAPLTTMPSTLLLHSDCIARVTESMVVCPMRTTSSVPWHSVESRFASAANSSGGLSRITQLNSAGQPVQQQLHFAQIQQFQRIDHRLAGRHDVQIGPGQLADALVQRNLAQQIIRDAGAAVHPNRVCMMGRRKSKSASSVMLPARWASASARFAADERFAFGRRRAGHHHRINRLQALHVVQPGAQRAELLHGSLVRTRDVDQQRIRRGAKRNLLDLLQQSGQVGTRSRIQPSRRPRSRRATDAPPGAKAARLVRRGAMHHVLDSWKSSSESTGSVRLSFGLWS